MEAEYLKEQELKSDSVYGFNEEKVYDSLHELYSPVAEVTLPIDRIPDDIQRRMKKVFSKHSVPEVREWSSLLMKSYQLLHAIEKPMNLMYVKPFSNTSDLVNNTPTISEKNRLDAEESAKRNYGRKDGKD